MKKLFILSLAALAFASCTNKEDDPISDPSNQVVKLVDAKINVQMNCDLTTRAYLGSATQDSDGEHYTINHNFEEKDMVKITDYAGSYLFTADKDGQTTTLSGQWAEVVDGGNNGILAAYPYYSSGSVTKNGTDGIQMSFTLPENQESRIKQVGVTTKHITYDTNAGLAFACAETKSSNLWFMPVVSYLYFYSSKSACTIESTQEIAGSYSVTYTGSHGTGSNADGTKYNTAEGLSKFLAYSATSKKINCKGQHIDNHVNDFNAAGFKNTAYEYVICIKPGTYNEGELRITPSGETDGNFHNKGAVTLIPSQVYYLGCIDK